MDKQNLIRLFSGTLDPNLQSDASTQLDQMQTVSGFLPQLLDIVMTSSLEMPVRQSASVYMKNLILHSWAADSEHTHGRESAQHKLPALSDTDRSVVREAVIDAAVRAPQPIRQMLVAAVRTIVKEDFPTRWSGLVPKLCTCIQQQQDEQMLYAALLCLYQLTKVYEFRDSVKRQPLHEAMKYLLPLLRMQLTSIVNSVSESAVLIQKSILKIIYKYLSVHLSLEQFDRDTFVEWMRLVCTIATRDVPDSCMEAVDHHERHNLVWWKCRKWSLRLLYTTFDKYGRPGQVEKVYESFATWYLKTFTPESIKVMLSILETYRQKKFVSSRVLHQTLHYLSKCASLAFTWSILNSHISTLFKEVLFPILCFSQEDAELWDEDPCEFVRVKYDILEDYLSPVSAAQAFINAVCRRGKHILSDTMHFIVSVLSETAQKPQLIDGALHMVGAVRSKLLKREMFRNQLESMVVTHVFPYFTSQHGFLQARACWVIQRLARMKFESDANLMTCLKGLLHCLLGDTALPVQVEAAIAFQAVLSKKKKASTVLEPEIRSILIRIIEVIRKTNNHELTVVVQEIIASFQDHLKPVAVDLARHVTETFKVCVQSVIGVEEVDDEQMDAVIGVMDIMDVLLDIWEEEKEVRESIEPFILQAIVIALDNNVTDLFESVFQLVSSLTINRITADMWRVFEAMYRIFENEGSYLFEDMMPSLHNYLTVDTEGLLANPDRLTALFNICRRMLTESEERYEECHAAKLLECIVLQCSERISQYLSSIVELIVERMSRPVESASLRVMCLQVLIAVLYTQPQLFLDHFSAVRLPNSDQPFIVTFITQCLDDYDNFTGVHDRKLFILGMCLLLQFKHENNSISMFTSRLLPVIISVLQKLRKAYEERAQGEGESCEESEDCSDDDSLDVDSLDEDEDDIDDDTLQYLDTIRSPNNHQSGDTNNNSIHNGIMTDELQDGADTESSVGYLDNYEDYTTTLDTAQCTVDEFVVFRDTMQHLQHSELLQAMQTVLTPEQTTGVRELFLFAEQRQAASQAKILKEQGGFSFAQTTVPSGFNFGSPNSLVFGGPQQQQK